VLGTNTNSRLQVIVPCKHCNMLSLNLMKFCLVNKCLDDTIHFLWCKVLQLLWCKVSHTSCKDPINTRDITCNADIFSSLFFLDETHTFFFFPLSTQTFFFVNVQCELWSAFKTPDQRITVTTSHVSSLQHTPYGIVPGVLRDWFQECY